MLFLEDQKDSALSYVGQNKQTVINKINKMCFYNYRYNNFTLDVELDQNVPAMQFFEGLYDVNMFRKISACFRRRHVRHGNEGRTSPW